MRWNALILLLAFSFQTLGQSKKFVSSADENMSLQTLTVAPIVDNVSGIYAPGVTESINATLEKTHQWNTLPFSPDIKSTPEEFESTPETVKKALQKSKTDGLIAGRLSRGPKGINLKLTLYVGPEGLPVGSETLSDYSGFEVVDIKAQTEILTKRLMHRLPYHAVVLSRKGQLVTIGMGTAAGLAPGVELTALQVIKVNRHPKYNFIVGTENLTLGKIKIEKCDEYLCFASVIAERDPNLIATGTKVSWDKFIIYPGFGRTADGKLLTDGPLNESPVAFGDKPKEWVPQHSPSFGQVGLMFGLGSYSINNGLSSGGVAGTSSAVPSLHATGEMWLSPNWYGDLRIDTYVFSVNNGLSGSSPGTLNVSATQTLFAGGYNFLLNDDFYGPKIKIEFGYSVLSMTIDGSIPAAFESTNYNGMYLGIGGEFPIPIEEWRYPITIGGRLRYYLTAAEYESPTNSGTGSNNKISEFAAYGRHQTSEHFNFVGELEFNTFSSSFSGSGTRAVSSSSTSETITSISGGLEYMF